MLRNFTAADVPEQRGRTVLITGANSGIGFEAAKVLAARGARVLLACRSEQKAEAAIDAIRLETPAADLAFVALDLADLASVRTAAVEVNRLGSVDVLVANAGVMVPPLSRTADGFELQFGVNHLGHFALTGLLLPAMMERPGSRIVVTSSIAHRNGAIDLDDPNAEKRYGRMRRYQMSKLANLMHAFELDRRLKAANAATMAIACHPGVADTNLMRFLPGPARILMVPGRLFLNTAAEGAWPTLAAATAPSVGGGDFVGAGRRGETAGPAMPAKAAERAKDTGEAKRLWALSEALTGVEYPI